MYEWLMETKAQIRKSALRVKLIDAAEIRISQGGLRAVKARDLAKDAGCALGAIYNVFDDIGALFMEVNGRTFRRIGEAVAADISDARDASPNQRLIVMSNAYLGFATENLNLWRALFDLEMSSDGDVPDWYLEELKKLFAHIGAPLSELYPNMDRGELDLMTRALFSSVHGIVLLGLEKRISGVPTENIKKMIAQVLSQIG